MKELPILFNGPMIRAVLDGRKTQTRRVVKPQPLPISFAWEWVKKAVRLQWGESSRPGALIPYCPYGQPGDRIWVKETFGIVTSGTDEHSEVVYRANDPEFRIKWKSSIFMPHALSRITLEVTGVRVERVQKISDSDAKAEGIEWGRHEPKIPMEGWRMYGGCGLTNDPRLSYRTLWDSINTKRGFGWNANPWVWVIEFRHLTP